MALFTDTSVLIRTDEGESAARQPRRVASNRARAALLLLDGQLSVGEMKRRFGETLEVEDALMELLRDGLAVDRDDAVTDADEDLPVVDEVIRPEDPPTEMPADPELSLPPGFVVTKSKRPDEQTTQPPPTETPEAEQAEDVDLPPEVEVKIERIEPEGDIDASISAAYGGDSHVRNTHADAPEPSLLTLGLDRMRYYLTHAARGTVTLGIAAIIGILLILAWNAPEWFRQEIEDRAYLVSGKPVLIESLGPSWNNGPALQLSGVSVGDTAAALSIDVVEIMPDWFALTKHGSFGLSARLSGIRGRPTQLAEAFNRADFGRMGARRIVIEDLRVMLADKLDVVLSGQGEVSGGVLQQLVLSAGRKGVEYRVPMPLSFPLEFVGTASNWRAPFLSEVLLESLQFDGLLSDQGMQVVALGGAMYGGRYGGTMEFGWDEAVGLRGDIQLDGVRLERLMPALRETGDLEGALSGVLTLESEAPAFEGLAELLEITSKIQIDRGRFGGLDVGAIMRERGTGIVRGGATRFDSMRLDVSMNMKDRNVRAAIRRFDAGNLHVGGGLLIRPDDKLSGRLTSTLSAGNRSVSLPVLISGSLGSPALRLAPEAIQ